MLKKKILIDLDVLTVAEWEKEDTRKEEALEFLKIVGKKRFFVYVFDEQLEAVSKWENKNLREKIIKKLNEIKDEKEDAADLLEELKLEIGRNLEEFLDEFVNFTKSKRADLRLALTASALKVDYLVTFNRKHLKSKEKEIREFLRKYNLHTPKIVFPKEIFSTTDSRIKSFSFSHPFNNKSLHFFFTPFSQFIWSFKFSHILSLMIMCTQFYLNLVDVGRC